MQLRSCEKRRERPHQKTETDDDGGNTGDACYGNWSSVILCGLTELSSTEEKSINQSYQAHSLFFFLIGKLLTSSLAAMKCQPQFLVFYGAECSSPRCSYDLRRKLGAATGCRCSATFGKKQSHFANTKSISNSTCRQLWWDETKNIIGKSCFQICDSNNFFHTADYTHIM